jgi:hypothetical protein
MRKYKYLPSRYLSMQQIPEHLHEFNRYRMYIEASIHYNFWLLYWITNNDESFQHEQVFSGIAKEIGADEFIASSYAWKGMNFIENTDSAFYYVNKAYMMILDIPNTKLLGPFVENIALVYQRKGDQANKYKFLKLGLHYNVISGNIRNSGWSYMKFAWHFRETGIADSVSYYAQKAWAVANKGNYPDIGLKALDLLAKLYKENNQTDSAFKYLELFVDLKNKTTNDESIRQFEDVKATQLLKEKDLIAAKVRYTNRIKFYGLISGLITAIIITIIQVRNNRRRRLANVLLEKQKEETEVQKTQ